MLVPLRLIVLWWPQLVSASPVPLVMVLLLPKMVVWTLSPTVRVSPPAWTMALLPMMVAL